MSVDRHQKALIKSDISIPGVLYVLYHAHTKGIPAASPLLGKVPVRGKQRPITLAALIQVRG